MKICRSLSAPKKKRCLAIGIFDGVHRGHADILRRVVREAKKLKASPAIMTFDPHPRKVLSGDHKNPAILMSLEHRLRTIALLGIQEAVVVGFNKKFASIPREKFLEDILIKKLGMKMLAVGHDFRFGRFAKGDAAYLRKRAKDLGFRLFLCPPVKRKGKVISSTIIRRFIEKGSLSQAADMLGRPVSIYGTVVHGSGRGRGIGFPTANLDPHHETLPPDGVYAVTGDLDGKPLKGVLHIGKRPTFGLEKRSVEAHFFDLREDLYGREIELFFAKKIRPIERFKNASALTKAIRRDIQQARQALREPAFSSGPATRGSRSLRRRRVRSAQR